MGVMVKLIAKHFQLFHIGLQNVPLKVGLIPAAALIHQPDQKLPLDQQHIEGIVIFLVAVGIDNQILDSPIGL